jgi:hypothetical protein
MDGGVAIEAGLLCAIHVALASVVISAAMYLMEITGLFAWVFIAVPNCEC